MFLILRHHQVLRPAVRSMVFARRFASTAWFPSPLAQKLLARLEEMNTQLVELEKELETGVGFNKPRATAWL